MFRKSSIFAVAFVFGIFGASFAFAQQQRPVQRMHRMERPQMAKMQSMARLQLTDEQRGKMMDMRLAMEKELAPLKAKLVSLRTDLKLLITVDNPDMKKIEAKQKQIGQVQTQIRLAMTDHQVKVRQLLTPEQRKKFDAAILSGQMGKRIKRMMMRAKRHRLPGRGMMNR